MYVLCLACARAHHNPSSPSPSHRTSHPPLMASLRFILALVAFARGVQAFLQTSATTLRDRRLCETICVRPRYTSSVAVLKAATSDNQRKTRARRKGRNNRSRSGKTLGVLKNPWEVETWRVYSVDVDPDALGSSASTTNRRSPINEGGSATKIPPERSYLTPPVLRCLLSRLRIDYDVDDSDYSVAPVSLPPQLKDATVVRRSLDARRRRGANPKYTYVIDISLTREAARELNLSHQPGKMEIMGKLTDSTANEIDAGGGERPGSKPKILIIGSGPAGLFCALSLASSGLFTPIILERGRPVVRVFQLTKFLLIGM